MSEKQESTIPAAESKPQPSFPPLPLATPQEVTAYFEERGVNQDCPFCGNTDWEFYADEGIAGAGLPMMTITRSINQSYLPLLIVTCTKCTFVRQHAYEPFLQWLENRRSQKEANDEE